MTVTKEMIISVFSDPANNSEATKEAFRIAVKADQDSKVAIHEANQQVKIVVVESTQPPKKTAAPAPPEPAAPVTP